MSVTKSQPGEHAAKERTKTSSGHELTHLIIFIYIKGNDQDFAGQSHHQPQQQPIYQNHPFGH
jgi:hypothetical protein